jgi:chromosomal replication initiation ATPase DnaA
MPEEVISSGRWKGRIRKGEKRSRPDKRESSVTENGEAEAIAEAFMVKVESMRSREQTKSVSNARNAWYWILRSRGLSLNEVGAIVGRGHDTVLLGSRRAEMLRKECRYFRASLDRALKSLAKAFKKE